MVNTTVSLSEAQSQLSQFVERAAAGEEIIILKDGRPLAKLVPLQTNASSRKPCLWEGRLWVADDFDAPLPEAILAGFEGNEGESSS
jgi:prevent-host-death family protein